MLEIQKYLKENSIENLKEELSINVYYHPTLNLVGFKYDQIKSPKRNLIVKECRGIVLESDTWKLVAKGFDRFFNAGETPDEYYRFNWNSFECTEKVDGSLVLLYWYNGDWRVNTSGSFGLGEVPFSGKTWSNLFWETSGITEEIRNHILHRYYTYVFELCTVCNKVVRTYAKPTVFLLSIFRGKHELKSKLVDVWAEEILCVSRPEHYKFVGESDIYDFLSAKQTEDPTFEGVVIRDDAGLRFKIKSKTYLAYHHLKDNGNVASPKNIIPLIFAGETDEVCSVFPELREQFEDIKEQLNVMYDQAENLWIQNGGIPTQKEFALAIKDHPLAGLLFNFRRKYGSTGTEKLLWQEFCKLDPAKLAEKLK